MDYDTWLKTHQQWFASQFPWIFEAQKILRDLHEIEADYIDLLMISGHIWQFHYPSVWHGPIAMPEPIGIRRLAAHHGIDPSALLEALDLPPGRDRPPDANQTAAAPAVGETWLAEVRRWHADIDAASGTSDALPIELLLFTLRASQYLAQTRAAAYLWAKTHPEQVRQLLADSARIPMPLMVPAALAEGEWITTLRQQAVSARNCAAVASEWLLLPRGTACAPEASEQQRALATLVAELTPSAPDQREGHGQ